jgi:hypothetical protein
MADPSANDREFGWRTKFWSLGFSTEVGELIILAQALIGSTVIVPVPAFISTTYLYAGYRVGTAELALRGAVRPIRHKRSPTRPGFRHQ